MKKTLVLTSLATIMATGAANAATDVNFAGDYQLGNGSTANVGTALNGSTYTYTYTKSDSTTATVAQNVAPDLHFFTYTPANAGDPDNLYDGGTGLTASDFAGTSAATGDVTTTQPIEANQTISRNNYTYVNGKGETVTLGETAQSFTETVALNSTYATVASVDVTDSSAAPVLAGTMYSYTDPDTGAVYHLNATGDEWVDANNLVVTPDAGTPQEAARDAMVSAFAADSAAITAAKTAVDGYATAEATAFAAANGIYTTDEGKIATLTANYGTYTDATTLLEQAQAAQTARQGDFAADQALEAAAAGLYNTPIETVQAATLQDAKDYANGLAVNYATAAQGAKADTALQASDLADYSTTAEITDAITGLISEKETNMSAQLGYDVTKNPANESEENSLINKLHSHDTSIVAGINTNYDAIALLNADENTEGSVAYAVKGEETRAKGVEAELDGKITAEAQARVAEDKAIRGEMAAGDALTLQSAKAFAAEQSALTLSQANAYTDKKVDTLEKNLSGGVAAATALSAVNVSNVSKGEVSVGAGYGYYNSQSAAAFGAAMGLSDRWSINAGAGIAQGDKTQFSIRAGTNYKFKLF